MTEESTLLIFTDGSRLPCCGHKRAGAAYAAFHKGSQVYSGAMGLGKRAGIYDAKMLALAGGARAAATFVKNYPLLSHILILADNQAAISTISDTSAHPAQSFSILFCKKIDEILSKLPHCKITIQWVPGHQGI